MKSPTATTVMVVDDHPLVRVGMATVVDRQRDMRTVATAESAEEAISLFRRHRPDVVLMDLRLRADSGARATGVIRAEFPDARVIMVSNYEGDADIRQALASGAKGYLFKSIVEEELLDAVREVAAGREYLPHRVRRQLQEHPDQERLTTREDEVLDLVAKGLHNPEIADVLGISDETVKTHVKSVFRKLGVSDRVEAVREAIDRGLIRN
jgi:DNA-binding NarL/FixJ family response regulator